MSMFNVRRGAKKSFRKKITVREDDDEDDKRAVESEQNSISTQAGYTQEIRPAPSLGPAEKSGKEASFLSFASDEGEEGDGEVFQVRKKKDHGKRLAKMMAREKRKEKKLVNSASTVSKVKSEAESRTRQRELSDEEDPLNEDSGDDEERILAGEEALEEESQAQSIQRRLGPGGIPDSSTVHAIRKHRELMRQIGQNVPMPVPQTSSSRARDYLPLDTSAARRTDSSRLVREDDNDRSDNEEDGKQIVMNFGTGSSLTTQQRVINALEDVASDEDEETKRWEEEQINKGVKVMQLGSLQQDVDPYQYYSGGQNQFGYGTSRMLYGGSAQYHTQQWVGGETGDQLKRLPHKLAPVTLSSLKQRLLNQLKDLTEVNSDHQQSLSTASEDLKTYSQDVEQFEDRTSVLAGDYKFYQETRAYLRNLLGCLGEKNAEISALEEKVFGIWCDKTERLIMRRHQDVLDLMEECSRIDGVAKQDTTVELDQFGRDKNIMKEEARKRRMANCAGRKRRRRERRDKTSTPSAEGLSTDDEEIESDLQRMALELDNIKKDSDTLFDDVMEDFCSLPLIMKHFEEWKFSRQESYEEAFIPLSAQKVFVPFVKHEMIFWNPLESQCKDLEDHQWFRTLLFYGHQLDVPVRDNDEDNLLLPTLVETVVLTKLSGLAEKVWDPLSSTQTQRLVSRIKELQQNFPTISPLSKPLQNLYSTVMMRVRKCLDADVYIPLYSKQQLENTSSLHYQFYQNQFWKAVKLFGNIALLKGTFVGGDKQVKELAVDGLLNRYLVMSLQNLPPSVANVEKLSLLMGKIPSEWVEDGSGFHFRSLSRCITQLADNLYQSTIGHPDHQRRKVKASLQTLLKFLKTLGPAEETERMIAAYSI